MEDWVIKNYEASVRFTESFYGYLVDQGFDVSLDYVMSLPCYVHASDLGDACIHISCIDCINTCFGIGAMLCECEYPFRFYLWKYIRVSNDEYGAKGHKFLDINLKELDRSMFPSFVDHLVRFYGLRRSVQLSLF